MKRAPLTPAQVMPHELADVVEPLATWFVIGGQAMRCLCPYRPSRDVDFGVHDAHSLDELLKQLQRSGRVEILERSADTVHLLFNGIKVSVFVLATLRPYVQERRLDVIGLLATKLHAILDRGTRRDFFDLYVTLQREQLGLAEALAAMRRVYRQEISEPLLLRALTYFDDAEREAPLPGEGPRDWETIKSFLRKRAGDLLIPPPGELAIQAHTVDVKRPSRRSVDRSRPLPTTKKRTRPARHRK